jgi:hypothetical protein
MIRASKNSSPRPRRKNRKARPRCSTKRSHARHNMKYWEIIADNLSKAEWSWGCVSAIDSCGRTIWIADAHRDNGKRFVVHAEEKLTASVELESATRIRSGPYIKIRRRLTRRIRTVFVTNSSRELDGTRRFCLLAPARPCFHIQRKNCESQNAKRTRRNRSSTFRCLHSTAASETFRVTSRPILRSTSVNGQK